MENQAKLIKAEINLLGAQAVGPNSVAVTYEFPYRAKYGDRRWSKQILAVDCDTINDPSFYEALYNLVQDLRRDLEG